MTRTGLEVHVLFADEGPEEDIEQLVEAAGRSRLSADEVDRCDTWAELVRKMREAAT